MLLEGSKPANLPNCNSCWIVDLSHHISYIKYRCTFSPNTNHDLIKLKNLAQEQSSKNALAKRIRKIMDSLAVTPWGDHGCECDCPKPCLKLTLIMPSIRKRGPKELPSSRKWQQDLAACLIIVNLSVPPLMVDWCRSLFSKLQDNYSSSNVINSSERTKRKVECYQ